MEKRLEVVCPECKKSKGLVLKKDLHKLCRSCARKKVHKNHSPEMKKHLSELAVKQFTGHSPWNKGKSCVYSKELLEHWSNKHKEWVSDELNKATCAPKNPSKHWLGKELPIDTKIKLSCVHRKIDIEDFDDFKHISKDQDRRKFDYLGISEKTFKRDDYTCQCCGATNTQLNAHHVESFNNNKDLRFELSNLVTLCLACHKNFHIKYSRGNNNKQQYDEYVMTYKNTPRKIVYCIAGVPGSGKSFIGNNLKNCTFIDKDKHKDVEPKINESKNPVLSMTVGVSTFIKSHPEYDIKLVVIQESLEVIEQRMLSRGGKITGTIKRRIKRMEQLSKNAVFHGTSEEVLNYLNKKAHF